MLRIFTPVKIQRLRPGLNPQTWVPEASMLTARPPKPSSCVEGNGSFIVIISEKCAWTFVNRWVMLTSYEEIISDV